MLKEIKHIAKMINNMNRYKNCNFEDFKNFWNYTKDVKSQEEYKQKHEEAIQEGANVIKSIIIDQAKILMLEKDFKKWYKGVDKT